MAHVTGDITTFLAALDQPEESGAVRAVVDAQGGDPVVEEFADGPRGRSRYLSFHDRGLTLLLEGGVVAAVLITVRPSGPYAAYADLPALVDGLPSEARREHVRALLGDPVRSSDDPAWELFAIDGRFVNVAYDHGDDDAAVQVTLMARDPSLPVAEPEVRPEGVVPLPFGDVSDVVDLVATPWSDELLATALLVTEHTASGPQPGWTEEELERDGVAWLQVSLTAGGVDLQVRDGVVVGAVVHVAREDASVHPQPAHLLADLPLPTGREQVRAALGPPALTTPTDVTGGSFDLYHLAADDFTGDKELDLGFDHRDDQVVSLRVLQRGAGIGPPSPTGASGASGAPSGPVRWDVVIGELAAVRTELARVAPDVYPLAVPRLAADAAAIAAAEQRLGHPLDAQLREFLTYADGWPDVLLDGDVLGARDLGQGPTWERATAQLDLFYEMSPTDGLPERDRVLPVFVSQHQHDVMVVRLDGPMTDGGHEVLWLAHELVDRWPNVHEWLLGGIELVRTTLRRRQS